LFDEVKDTFVDIHEGTIVDCTLGYGGHSEALLEQNDSIRLIGIDRDDTALAFSAKRLERFRDRIDLKKGRFSEMIATIDSSDVRGVLADIGVSSLQLDHAGRGFGFEGEVLDMRMDQSASLSAKEVVNGYSQSELEHIFKEYGEVREYKKIAALIVQQRMKKSFESAKELATFCAAHLRRAKIHPATLVFQAIRIEVNGELAELEGLLDTLRRFRNCRVGIISFHSLEDRIVKNRFKEWSRNCICDANAFRCTCGNDHAMGKIITKKPIIATESEIRTNPRSRSAKLRVFDIG
jgi:16S rRNA (cytosine1402-N4)-methyltransferase